MAIQWLPITAALLTTLAQDPAPWKNLEASSDQRQPVYFGATPRDLAVGHADAASEMVSLQKSLKRLGERQILLITQKLGQPSLTLEAWPARDDEGRLTWTFARWQKDSGAAWGWLDAPALAHGFARKAIQPFLPQPYRPWRKAEQSAIFDDFLLLDDLYAKPVFGDCLWTDESGERAAGAWLPPGRAEEFRAQFTAAAAPGDRALCEVLPQPARLNGKARSFEIHVQNGVPLWPREIRWIDESGAAPGPLPQPPAVAGWEARFEDAYRNDVLTLDGEQEARFPISGKRLTFKRKNSADPANQLESLVDYLEERYLALGITTRRQRFDWRGIPQSNLIAIIPGTAPDAARRPVLMADHIDTAFCEDTFAQNGHRNSAPGADDNDTAVAALLRAAETLPGLRPARDIWLVHLTGEEFPADDLGARKLVSGLLGEGQDISGLVLMDMIGFHRREDRLFQISAGDSPESVALARRALDAAAADAPDLLPVLRTRFDARSYLYNTDGLIFSDAGYPVILLNEHLNALENLNRQGYHQTTDTSALVDFHFAASVAKVAIETAARLANVR